jgi:hypothetical protein
MGKKIVSSLATQQSLYIQFLRMCMMVYVHKKEKQKPFSQFFIFLSLINHSMRGKEKKSIEHNQPRENARDTHTTVPYITIIILIIYIIKVRRYSDI